jgi:uncharacterized protein YjiS (DUF1127 family)
MSARSRAIGTARLTIEAESPVADATPLATPWTALVAAASRFIAGIVKEHRSRRAISELERLDDRLLRDIGLLRSDIPFAVRHGRVPWYPMS